MLKSYFPAPSLDCPPEGPIALGSILADPLEPEAPLNHKPIPLEDEVVNHHVQHDVQTSLKKNREGGGGLFASVFEVIRLRISGGGGKSMHSFAKFEKLETSSFEPSDDYMKKSLSTPKVQQYLASRHIGKRVFIVTGVKIAFGGQFKSNEGSLGDAHVSLGLDASAAGVPLNIGAQAKASGGNYQTMAFKQAAPFVFAYRLREIRYRKGLATDKPYRDGALYGIGGNKDEEASTAEVDATPLETIIFQSVDDEDVTGDDLELESRCVAEHEGSGEGGDKSSSTDEDELCELVLFS